MASRVGVMTTRHRRNVHLLLRFGAAGASGVVVNLCTLVVLRRLGPHFDDAVVALGSTGFSLRWYHVYSTVAFLVANLSNFQLNRSWTFRSTRAASWAREYWPFLAVGLGVVLSTVYLRYHYVVDVIAGALLAWFGLNPALRLHDRLARGSPVA